MSSELVGEDWSVMKSEPFGSVYLNATFQMNDSVCPHAVKPITAVSLVTFVHGLECRFEGNVSLSPVIEWYHTTRPTFR